jgi:L-alanine-DL-glutamate epimerase-like enolase superfamily enzyme
MRITGIRTHVLQAMVGTQAFGWSQRVTDRRQAAICVVSTDAGIRGVGEAFYHVRG